ncbi:MAG: hypothetical protein ABEJ79_08100 [Halolamina sp.]
MRALALVAVALLVAAPVVAAATAPASPSAAPSSTRDSPSSSVPTAADADAADVASDNAAQATPATTATVSAPNGSNATRVMSIPGPAVQRTGVERYAVNVGAAATFGANASAIRMRTLAVVARVEDAPTNESRADRIRAALDDVRTRTTALRQRRAETLAAFNAGELGARRFVVRLARYRLEAMALRDRVSRLRTLASDTPGVSGEAAVELQFELQTFDGPVRQRAAESLAGRASPTRVYVETGPQGVELATVDGGSYSREAIRGALREEGDARVDELDALNVTARSYPEIWRTRTTDGQVIGPSSLLVTQVRHERGRLTAFVDADSREVFKEYQRRPLSSFVNRSAAVNVRSNLRLVVNRSYPGGPLRITVTDAETDEPVDATVTINIGSSRTLYVGPTGEDGTAWALSPSGSYGVTAVADGGTRVVVVQTNATEPPTPER